MLAYIGYDLYKPKRMHVFLKIITSCILIASLGAVWVSANNPSEPDYTTFRTIDQGTFNEYRFRLTEQFFALREHYRVRSELNVSVLRQMLETANNGYNYLPDNLLNQNALRELAIEVRRGIENPRNEFIYNDILQALATYIEQVDISQIQWSIEAIPVEGNAPLTSTFRVNAQDPTGTQINSANIRWWMNIWGEEVVIGRGVSINHTFRNEWRFTVFVDITSSHRNSQWNTDVLPYRWRVDINVQEQIASLNIRVNSDRVRDNDILKFTPEVANFWLVIDATNSLPSGGARFTQTEWDFWNGVRKTYSGPPRIERARYANEGEYMVRLKLTTNEWKTIETEFEIYVHNPIAKIEVNRQEWYIGDRFTFQAKMSWNDRNVTYNWEIIDIEEDSVVFQQNDRTFSHTFTDKWRYNVRLRVRKSSWETDQDTRIIAIESRNPIAEFDHRIPESNRPNRVFLDGTRSYDPDMSDNAQLEYVWYVDGERVELENPSLRWSTWFYTFPDVGTYIVSLEVIDPDWLRDIKQHNIRIESILSVHFQAFPRVIQREWTMRFVAEAPEAEVFEWDFWDGNTLWWSQSTVSHAFDRSWSFQVNLRVTDRNNNTNTFSRSVFVANSDSPLAFINTSISGVETPEFDANACDWAGAYTVDRVSTIRFDGEESINVDGNTRWLEYTWRIWNNKFATTQSVNHRFDEIGCFPVVLTVRSTTNGRTDRAETYVNVENLPPTLTSLDIRMHDESEDPVVVEVTAQGATDPDGVIQSYMWYYYTDIDPEPQDFRATRRWSTTFVIPRVTGTYYFVAVLRDNNEERITSEEITNSRHFITITGDNINTPLIWMRVDRNSIAVWDEVTFNVTAENILNQDISGDATFHWDFNGDGFYNMQTSSPTASYVYRNSWEFFAKVKVTYRWMSSTRNVTINVTNRLRADFWYFSIWNKFVFFDMSSWQVDSRQWDMWDDQTRSWNTFIYEYNDGRPSRDVELTVSEGTRVDTITKTVRNNPRNVLRARQPWLVAFTYPERNDDGDIVLEVASDRVFVYMWESSESAEYVIDFDIEHDSNLDGSRDNDEDNRWTPSFVNGSIIEIPLNSMHEQTMRLFLRDEEWNVTASKDITIIKEFIEDTTIDPDTIVFENVTEEEQQKLDRLKRLLSELPQNERLQSLQFVQRLQQNWFDKTEKTRIIIDFENYIFELNLSNEDEIIDILESLLVTWQEDQSQLQIIYQALINLVPQDIQCEVETGNCYDNIISKLTDIRQSEDIEYNRELGREILQVIADTDLMTNEQKLDFRAILITLVYRGDVNAIPEEEKDEIIKQTPTWTRWLPIFSLIINISLIIWAIFWVFLLILLVLYLIYRSLYKWRDDVTFQQFITRNTWADTPDSDDFNTMEDILWDIDEPEKNDILSFSDNTEKKTDTWDKNKVSGSKSINTTKTQDTLSSTQAPQEEVPSWLKNWSPDVDNKNISKTSQDSSPSFPEKSETKIPQNNQNKKNIPKQTPDVIEAKQQDDFEANALPEDSQVPDWLKWSFDTSIQETPKSRDIDMPQKQKISWDTQNNNIPPQETWDKKQELPESDESDNQVDLKQEKYDVIWQEDSKEKVISDIKQPSNISHQANNSDEQELQIPDWLKWSFTPEDSSQSNKTQDVSDSLEYTPTEKWSWDTQISEDKTVAPVRRSRSKKEAVNTWKNQDNKKSKSEKSQQKNTSKNDKKDDELWDDGMKIPDWLKSSDDSESK